MRTLTLSVVVLFAFSSPSLAERYKPIHKLKITTYKRATDCLNIPQSQAVNYNATCATLRNANMRCSARKGDPTPTLHCCCEYDSPVTAP
jgi:hypothetical protein